MRTCPRACSSGPSSTCRSPLLFLLGLNLFLLVVGCLMDIYSAIFVVVPLIVPLGVAFHIHPVHLGIIFIANLELGYLTPPVGLNLFLASYRFSGRCWRWRTRRCRCSRSSASASSSSGTSPS